MGFDGGMMGDWSIFGWLWMLGPLLFGGSLLALIVWAVARVFPVQRSNERREPNRESAEDILGERFARGEIDAREYDSSLITLRGENHPKSGKVER